MRKGKVWVNPNPGDRWWDREIVTLRRAAVDYHACGECHNVIKKGDYYYEDKFIVYHSFGGRRKSYIHRVCRGCWRGVSLTGSMPLRGKLKLGKKAVK
jgi:hypothetical protein